MPTEEREQLKQLFSDKIRLLQEKINEEIDRNGYDMIIAREDVLYWVYEMQEDIKTFETVCRKLSGENVEVSGVIGELSRTIEVIQEQKEVLLRQRDELNEQIKQMQQKEDDYSLALKVLSEQSL